MEIPRKISWQERCRQVDIYHRSELVCNPNWRVADTAEELDRSIGRISEDLMLASWMKTDPKVERFENMSDALNYVRKKKHEMKVRT